MDTPTDTGPDPSWRLRRPQPSISGPAEVPGPPPPPAGIHPSAGDANAVPASSLVDDAVPSAPPSPPADPAPTPPPPPPPASTDVTPASSAAVAEADDDRTAAATLETQPALDPGVISGAASAAPAPAGATASEGSTELAADLVAAATTAEAEDAAHAAAPAGPAEESSSPLQGKHSLSWHFQPSMELYESCGGHMAILLCS